MVAKSGAIHFEEMSGGAIMSEGAAGPLLLFFILFSYQEQPDSCAGDVKHNIIDVTDSMHRYQLAYLDQQGRRGSYQKDFFSIVLLYPEKNPQRGKFDQLHQHGLQVFCA